mmetsp:Transcript_22731/g.37607  ORF Transcript_22731/g.37607 Transcript_22731/m.37607 type:complete len:226 (+) Transcript_22731:171-848(+)
MIWSTRSTVTAASVANRIASFFVANRSITPQSLVVPSTMSTPTPSLPDLCAAYIAATMFVASSPAFSASVRGTTSRARPNLLIAYWSRPGCASPNCCNASARRSSQAPAPGTKRASRAIVFTTFTPSSIALSTSSMMFIDEPRTTMVAVRESLSSWSNIVHIVEPISFTYTCLHVPRSSGLGGSSRTKLFAPVDRHRRRSSNLLGTFRQAIPYLSTKCRASSPID